MSLIDKTLAGFFWSFLQNIGGQSINFIVMIILARLLSPTAFGLIGMLMIFIQVSQTLVIAGFNQALIQKQNVLERDFSSVFWINLIISLVIYIILFLGAPLIAKFYDQAILINLTRVLSLVFVINAFSYVQEARLTKNMEFKKLTFTQLPSTVLGGVVSIMMALKGYGVWSIVALQLVTRIAFAIQIWIYARWKPLFIFNRKSIKTLFSFGGNLMMSQLINTIFKNIYVVIIGKYFPLTNTGYYQNANNLVQYPTSTISRALQKVIFPAFSTIQHDNERLKKGHKRLIQQTLFWIAPVFIFTGVLAEPLFRVVFTEKWVPAVPYYQLLCIVGIFWPINIYGINIINIKGRSDLSLKLEIVKKFFILMGIIIVLLTSLSIYGIIIVQVLNSLIGFCLNSYYGGKFIQYSLLQQIIDLLPTVLLGIVAFTIVHILDNQMRNSSDIFRLLIGFALGFIMYFGIANLINSPLHEFKMLIRKKMNN